MINKKRLRTILLFIGILLLIIQFFQINKTNPPIDVQQDFIQNTHPPAEIANILKTSCYDCHSHTTTYPWYTNIQPFAWWIKGHINNSRKHLNLSTWTTYSAKKKAHKIEEMVEKVGGKEMPMLSYMVGHPDAWIDEGQRIALVNWFKTLK